MSFFRFIVLVTTDSSISDTTTSIVSFWSTKYLYGHLQIGFAPWISGIKWSNPSLKGGIQVRILNRLERWKKRCNFLFAAQISIESNYIWFDLWEATHTYRRASPGQAWRARIRLLLLISLKVMFGKHLRTCLLSWNLNSILSFSKSRRIGPNVKSH